MIFQDFFDLFFFSLPKFSEVMNNIHFTKNGTFYIQIFSVSGDKLGGPIPFRGEYKDVDDKVVRHLYCKILSILSFVHLKSFTDNNNNICYKKAFKICVFKDSPLFI